jgi:hypothetical protein
MPQIHDRRATDLPYGAQTATIVMDDVHRITGEPATLVEVTISTRDDPLAYMYAHRSINEAAYLAGRRYQRYYHDAEVSARAIDPGAVKVDGGGMPPDHQTDRRVDAIKALAEVKAMLGADRACLVHDVLGCGLWIYQAAQVRGVYTNWGTKRLAKKFRIALDDIADHFGMVLRRP